MSGPPLAARVRVIAQRPVALGLATIVLFWGASLPAYTYLVPLLEQRTGLHGNEVTAALLLAGIMAVAGNLLGGRAADHDINHTLRATALTVTLALAALGPAASQTLLVLATVALWQLAAWTFSPAIQVCV